MHNDKDKWGRIHDGRGSYNSIRLALLQRLRELLQSALNVSHNGRVVDADVGEPLEHLTVHVLQTIKTVRCPEMKFRKVR